MPRVQIDKIRPAAYEAVPSIQPASGVFPAVLEKEMGKDGGKEGDGRAGQEAKPRHLEPVGRSLETYKVISHPANPGRRRALRARDLMTRSVFHLPESASLSDARNAMAKRCIRHLPVLSEDGRLAGMLSHRIHSLPVVDPDNRLVGILTTTDILRALAMQAPLELWA